MLFQFNNNPIDPKHPQRVAICKANVPHEESTDLTFYFDGQRRNSAADMVCENNNNQTVCEVSLTLTEPITRDMHQSEVKCVYADERDDIERGKARSEELDSTQDFQNRRRN